MSEIRRQTAQFAARVGLSAAALALAATAFAAPAAAEVASAWDEGYASRARLVAGQVAREDGAESFAGIEIRLKLGWKTYWRNPGDAGIPPRFDWSGSVNLKSAEILFPAPHRLPDPAGQSIGYKNQVVFPVRLSAEDPAKPVHLSLKLDYAACEALCVPAEARLQVTVPAGVDTPSFAIAEALDRVPRRANGEAGAPRIVNLAVKAEGKARQIAVTVAQPQGAEETDLFVEGPENWYLSLPQPDGRHENGGETLFAYAIDLDGVPKSADLSGETLKLTIVNGADAVEQEWTLR